MHVEPLQVGVAGAGVMGAGIAQVLAMAGYDVVYRDVAKSALDQARKTVETGRFGVRSAVERGKLTSDQADRALQHLTFTTDPDALTELALAIEAIPEFLDLKIHFWRELDRIAGRETIFASNSSGFPVGAMAAGTDRPDRFIGWHWASPAPIMRLAEITRARTTSDETADAVVTMAEAAGKNPVVITDTDTHWGYVTNRVYLAMIREAMTVVQEGIAEREEIDQLMMDCFRWPAGPFGMTRGATSGWK